MLGSVFDGDAAAVVGHGDRAVEVDGHLDDLGEAGHHFVDRVVDDLGHQVVQPADVAIADVHARPLADVLQVAHVAHLADFVLGLGTAGGRGLFGGIAGHDQDTSLSIAKNEK